MGNDGATYSVSELEGTIGAVSYTIKDLRVFTPRPAPRAHLEVRYLADYGKVVEAPKELKVPDEVLDQIALATAEAKVKVLYINIRLGKAAARRHETRTRITLGEAFPWLDTAEIYWQNVVKNAKPGQSHYDNFLSVLAHEVGHVLHHRVVGATVFYRQLTALDREYAAEAFVESLLGKQYVRNVQEKFYKNRR